MIGIRSAARISRLIGELEINVKERFLILNKAKGNSDSLEVEIDKAGLNLKTVLPLNEEIEDASIKNRPIFYLSENNPAFNLAKSLLQTRLKTGSKKR